MINRLNNSHYFMQGWVAMVAILLASFAGAHTPICDCYDNGDDTITCEGGFSDGASAAGVEMTILDDAGRALMQGQMSEYSDYTFTKPQDGFRVVFQAGDGHVIEIDSRDIEE